MACIRDDEELDELSTQESLHKLEPSLEVYGGVTLPIVFGQHLEAIDNIEVYDDDVWVTSMPKSGTTWTQELVWCIANDMDFEMAKMPLAKRFTFLELPFILKGVDTSRLQDTLLSVPRPRFIKTHLPWNLLPRQIRTFEKRPKIIHTIRNPKDVCVSYYHFCKLINNYSGDFKLFWQLFITGKLEYTPALKSMLTYWNKRLEPNVLILKYEDMKADLPSAITKVATYLGKTVNKYDMERLVDHLSFDSMRTNTSTNQYDFVEFMLSFKSTRDLHVKRSFMRKGIVGDHKSEMSPEVIEVFDKWIAKNLAGTGLSFD